MRNTPTRKAMLKMAIVTSFLSMCASSNYAATPAINHDQGTELARKMYENLDGWGTTSATINIHISSFDGFSQSGEAFLYSEEHSLDAGTLRKSIMRIDKPSIKRGLTLISYNYPTGKDKEWIYFPSAKKSRAIGESGRSSSFLNSNLSFEDLTGWNFQDFTYRYEGEHSVSSDLGGGTTYAVEANPQHIDTQYSKLVFYIDNQTYLPKQINFYTKGGLQNKSVYFHSFTSCGENCFVPSDFEMLNVIMGSRTRVTWRDIEFGVKVEDSLLASLLMSGPKE